MKKTRFLVLALAVAIMLMGAGYAYWTETLTIENTVTTGQLDFEFQEADIVNLSDYMNDDENESYCRVKQGDDNTIEIRLADMYPGAAADLYFELKNSGTMDAKVKNFDFTPDNAAGEYEHFLVTSFTIDEGSNIIGLPVKLSELETALAGQIIPIAKGEVKEFAVTLQIDPNAGNGDVRENAGKGDVPAYTFSLSAAGLQWNDDQN